MYKAIYNIDKFSRGLNKKLFVFDFDETITNANTDTWIYHACSGGKLPQDVLDKFISKGQWIEFMQIVFNHLHKEKVPVQKMIEVQQEIPIVPGMIDVLKYIKKENNDAIIISNANNLFIDWILEKHQLKDHIKRIYTNTAKVEEDGSLSIQGAHKEHNCPVCWSNQCKTKSLISYLEEIAENSNDNIYETISYFGDGFNDLCPILNLSKGDFGFCRRGFGLEDEIVKMEKEGTINQQIKANLIKWNDGNDVLQAFKENKL